jgi:hypothetical protein
MIEQRIKKAVGRRVYGALEIVVGTNLALLTLGFIRDDFNPDNASLYYLMGTTSLYLFGSGLRDFLYRGHRDFQEEFAEIQALDNPYRTILTDFKPNQDQLLPKYL